MIASPEQIAKSSSIDRLRHTISATRLGLFLQCRLKFFFRYIQQIRKPVTPALHAGSTAHSVLQMWNLARWKGEPFSVERFKTVFDTEWKTGQTNKQIRWEDEAADQNSSWRALEHYFTETPIRSDERPEAVEVSVEADLSHHGLPRLIGVLDLVRQGGRIVDFKLVAKTPDPNQLAHTHEVQLTSYSLLYRDATGRTETALELHHLVRTKQPKFVLTSLPPVSQQQHDRLFRLIESYQTAVDHEDFVPSPSFACAGCEFFNECRKWSG
jgi:putative RecB family exonuclease